ncbi:MAG: nitrate- and nitrite sensing domain-containing protein [Flavobacteriales bacterium]|nr:nitrate- and nitrite sensing domain-containing protein [Flavobacteriales bacterium]
MKWRFADLPVRTKFMVTLGIPVVGMVLLIGKQVDGSLKRLDVMEYINQRSRLMGLHATVVHEVQRESALSVGYITGMHVQPLKLDVQYSRTDGALSALTQPDAAMAESAQSSYAFDGLNILRQRVRDRRIDAPAVSRAYRAMDQALLDELGRNTKLALDPETKDRLYAHLRLLQAKQALSVLRDKLTIGYAARPIGFDEVADLSEQVSAYETNMLLFERDAPPEVLARYQSVFQGEDVNFMRSLIGTVKQRRSPDLEIAPREWWELSLDALEKLRTVEVHSLDLITQNTAANSRDAEVKLLIVIAALIGVVGAVTIMGILITRGVRGTVSEVLRASRSMAVGDVNVKVRVNSNDEIGEMARAFNGLVDNLKSLAGNADAIGKGDYDVAVSVRGAQDQLGLALARMKENLKAARLRDDEQSRALKAEKEKLEDAHQRISVLIKEMHHRVKNNLQVVASLLRLQAASFTDARLQEAFDESQSRVTSMALIHEKLYKGDELARVDVALYIHELFAELVNVNDVQGRVTHGTDIDAGLAFGLNTMVPLGLLLNELITNSFKHAFHDREEGRIALSLHQVEGDLFDLFYSDDGSGLPLERLQADGGTLGMTLIESLVEQMNGRMTMEGGPEGTRYQIRFEAR